MCPTRLIVVVLAACLLGCDDNTNPPKGADFTLDMGPVNKAEATIARIRSLPHVTRAVAYAGVASGEVTSNYGVEVTVDEEKNVDVVRRLARKTLNDHGCKSFILEVATIDKLQPAKMINDVRKAGDKDLKKTQ